MSAEKLVEQASRLQSTSCTRLRAFIQQIARHRFLLTVMLGEMLHLHKSGKNTTQERTLCQNRD